MATSFLIPEVYSACKPYTGIRSHPTSTRLSIVHNKCRTGQRLDREIGKLLSCNSPSVNGVPVNDRAAQGHGLFPHISAHVLS